MPFSAELAASGLQRPQVKNYQDCCLIYQILPMILLDSIKQTYSMGIILIFLLSINLVSRKIFILGIYFPFPPDSCNVAVSASAWKIHIPPGFVYFCILFLQVASSSHNFHPTQSLHNHFLHRYTRSLCYFTVTHSRKFFLLAC